MISSLFVILAIIPAVTSHVPSSEAKPDWSKCDEEATCLCYVPSTKEIEEPSKLDLPRFDCEKIGAQMKTYQEDHVIIQVQITGEAPGNRLMLHIKDKELYGCEFDKSGKARPAGDRKLLFNRNIGLFEDRSRSKQGLSLCALKVERSLLEYFDIKKAKNDGYGDAEIMQFSIDNSPPVIHSFRGRLSRLFEDYYPVASTVRCHPYSFNDKTYLEGFHVLPLMNRDKNILTCDTYPSSYKMKYEFEGRIYDMTELKCTTDFQKIEVRRRFGRRWEKALFDVYYYQIHTDKTDQWGPISIPMKQPQNYMIFCAAPVDELCPDPNPECTPDRPECPKYKQGQPGVPATLTCPGKKWLIGGKYFNLDNESEPSCISDTFSNQDKSAFFFVLRSGIERKVDTEARCFTDYDCNITRPIFLEDTMEYNNGVVKCKDPTITMAIHLSESKETLLVSSFACDKTVGLWKNMTSGALEEKIPNRSQLTCPRKTQGQLAGAKLSNEAIIGIIIGCSVFFMIVMVLIAFAVLRYTKNRRARTLDKSELRRMDRAARIKHCQEFFPKVLNTTTLSMHHIVDGLVELDVLLDMEIEDPDVWDTVYPFLMRIQGAITKIDLGCWHMFSRYLYLRAKAIIDKHGWTSKKLIRRGKQRGLIRVVAINLLSFALFDPINSDSEKLIEKGFRKLGFRGRKQYPHCGVLWSMISHARPRARKNKEKPELIRRFDSVKFNERLRNIALSKEKSKVYIPPDQIIPNFGTVAQQAAFAHGAWQYIGYHVENCQALMKNPKDGGSIALAFFAGAISSLTRCPAQSILLMLLQIPKPKPEVLARLWQIAPREEWNKQLEKAFKIVNYYGRHLDANRLEERFITNSQKPSAALKQLQQEQHEFVDALGKQLEELREWYAEHTDKDEFKQKPVYTTKPEQTNRNASAPASKNPPTTPRAASLKSKPGPPGSGKSSGVGSSDSTKSPGSPDSPAPSAGPLPGSKTPAASPAPASLPGSKSPASIPGSKSPAHSPAPAAGASPAQAPPTPSPSV